MRASTALLVVLWIKILITLLFWSLPLLLLPMSYLERMGIPSTMSSVFIRLLGAAYTALLVGYILAVRDLRRNRNVSNTVWVGIVSNGLACIILFYFGYAGAWQAWSGVAQLYMWLSALLTGGITIGLIWSGLLAGGATGAS